MLQIAGVLKQLPKSKNVIKDLTEKKENTHKQRKAYHDRPCRH